MKIYPRVFFQDFIVLVFIAKSLVRFELIFVSVLTEGPSFLLFACASPVVPAPLLEKTVLFPPDGLGTLVENQGPCVYGFICGPSILVCWSICLAL